jgi:hypothetical protein
MAVTGGKYHGKSGAVYMSKVGTGTALAITTLNSWSLDMATDTVEVTAFGDANKTYVQGLKDLKGSFSGFFDNSDDSVFQASDSADGCKLYLYPSTNLGTNGSGAYWYGPAWVNASIECGNDSAVTISADFVAKSSWGRYWYT